MRAITWSDYDLEAAGRLAEPMRYGVTTDRYVPVSWQDAFDHVGSTLRGLASPDEAAFYTSGRLSNEATFLYQLWVREYGTNNLPDCSNMCHEASGNAMTAALGTGKGTVDVRDWIFVRVASAIRPRIVPASSAQARRSLRLLLQPAVPNVVAKLH
jgi:anaerobic selenocysteine-containing dehydrogenase